jgi:glycosyltransferase involved in cell wall biosynthesis
LAIFTALTTKMPDTSPKILFLAANVQPFLLTGIRSLIKNYNAKVLVICRPVSKSAPNQILIDDNIQFIFKENNKAAIQKSIWEFEPNIVWAAGWMDKDYLTWIKKLKPIPAIMAMDAQWFGTLRQHINVFLAPIRLKPIYDYVWVPGVPQRIYAKKLGFSDAHILEGLLTPDITLFSKAYEDNKAAKALHYPKAFLYIGELLPQKVENLLQAFTTLKDEELDGWKLIVIGKGALENDIRLRAPFVDYRGFIQQPALVNIFKKAGVFCLTSTSEAWGVVIQESAAAGMPLIVSKQCGAHSSMLRDGDNGFLCDGESIADIQEKLKMMIALPSSELLKMGEKSHKIGAATNPDLWAKTLMKVYRK